MRARVLEWWEITWRPPRLSTSFHGRDLFAPVAARIARGDVPPGERRPADSCVERDWPDDYPHIIYIDHFGNAVSGVRAASLAVDRSVRIRGHVLGFARTFCEVPTGQGFWYENSSGLLECAVNQGRADRALGIMLGDELSW
jgi:S-adenosylmethionine hydrolase